MKQKKLLLWGVVFLIAMGFAIGLSSRGIAQQEVVKYLEERLRQQDIPLVEIVVQRQFPLHLEIKMQSISESEKAMPEDPLHLHMAKREVVLARQQGYIIDRLTLALLNKQEQTIFWAEIPVDIETISFQITTSTLGNEAIETMVLEKLDVYEFSLVNTKIATHEGMHTLSLWLSTQSLEMANHSLPYFMSSLRSFIDDINTQGAQIVICKVELVDEKGQILLKYLLDLQLDSETWWMVDNLNRDWFPHPPLE